MPYFNPTWVCGVEAALVLKRQVTPTVTCTALLLQWDPLSPTLAPFNGAFGTVAALNATGGAYYETYPDKPIAKTCVVCQCEAFCDDAS